ncbi:Increased recombination centers protein 22-2 [Trametes pubescens]|uniref:Increased recombination centers protein 22-2 n=1 Tax=Trametes pubescens TaxID=154538 RepID=A0A1M2VB14_TRAPU|nr:Increased recombination centers protein 22-2 [Trametes pubescens]
MRLFSFLGLFLGSAAFVQNAVASPVEGETGEPVVLAVAAFPEDNAFGHVVNGERNKIFLSIENKSARNVTLKNIAGSFHIPESNRLVKNTSALSYGIPLLEGASMQLPYTFHSEFKPGDYRLNIWLEHVVDGETYRVTAYDSIVAVVEPAGSWIDLKLWTTYLIVTGLLGALSFYVYTTLFPQQKKRKTSAVSAPVGTVTATGAGGYQEEWIPEHHLKKATKKSKASGVATSGDETSGVESGTEGRRRKGKK